MHPFQRSLRLLAPWLAAGLLATGPGCSSLTTRSHQVQVDAITGQPGTAGVSFQFVAKDPRSTPANPSQHERVLACVEAALADRGMFAAPPKTQPDMLIAVDYGIGSRIPTVDGPPAVEKYLQLAARKIIDLAAGKTQELWNVRVIVSEPNSSLGNSLPILAAVAADYAGLDTQAEKVVSIPDNSPVVARLREVLRPPAGAP